MGDRELYLDIDTGACTLGGASVTDEQRRLFGRASPTGPAWFALGGRIKDGPTTVSRHPSVCNIDARDMDDTLWQNCR